MPWTPEEIDIAAKAMQGRERRASGPRPRRQPIVTAGRHGRANARRLGKKAAGRLLDGREWNEVPG